METFERTEIISADALLSHWQGHRRLTRRVIDAFPEDDFMNYSVAGMRTPAQLTTELLSIGGPAMKAIVERDPKPYDESGFDLSSKAEFLRKWDEQTAIIDEYWAKITHADFQNVFNLFGQYEFPIIQNILYFIDNECHHRGQMYVYLRTLGIEPPFFWER